MTKAEMARGKALWAERKANEASASDAPWAMGNLRLYQNMASKFWGECFAAERTRDSLNPSAENQLRSFGNGWKE